MYVYCDGFRIKYVDIGTALFAGKELFMRVRVNVVFAAVMLAAVVFAGAASAKEPEYPFLDVNLPMEQRVQDLVSRLTLEEKAGLMNDESAAVPRLGIKKYHYWNEALHGVARSGKFTVFPMSSGIGATWDPELIERITTAISDEAWGANNRDAATSGYPPERFLNFWSPTINMARDPRWGRTPETYGEDPYLTSRLAVAFVRGLQGYDKKYVKTVATPKHFAVNNIEHNRLSGNADVSEKTLHEYYFPAFQATVEEANAQSIMGAYNALNGIPCNANKWLLTDVLRKDWGFNGFVVTDCGAMTHMTREHLYSKDGAEATAYALNAGVNVECGSDFVIPKNLVAAVKSGKLSEEKVNEATAELIRERMRLGMFDPPEMNPYTKISPSVIGSEEHKMLARRTSQESIVLLKNDKAGSDVALLPLDLKKIKTIAVIGPYGDRLEYGEYSGTPANEPVTLLAGLKKRVGNVKIDYVPWITLPDPTDFTASAPAGGFKAEFFNSKDLSGTPAVTRDYSVLSLSKADMPKEMPATGGWSARWTATFKAENPGMHVFSLDAAGRALLKINGKTVIEFNEIPEKPKKSQMKAGALISFDKMKPDKNKVYRYAGLFLEKGEACEMTVEYEAMDKSPMVKLAWQSPKGDAVAARKREMDAIRGADIVIAAMGYEIDDEREGMDRDSLDLPPGQSSYILSALGLNPNLVLTLTNGSPLGIPDVAARVPAILETWYPGEQGGEAIADVLIGSYNPAGRVPFTYHSTIEELPPFDDYEISKGRTYMYFKGNPIYPFGYGLSYTTFGYSGLKLAAKDGRKVSVKFALDNAGGMDGEEVAQVYARRIGAGADEPMKKLVGFKRVNVKKGEKKEIEIEASVGLLAPWDVAAHAFAFTPGEYEILVGSSSADIRLKDKITLK